MVRPNPRIIAKRTFGIYKLGDNPAFVAYYRVSTQAQGRSGLGLDAQRHAVESYVQSVSGNLISEFQEVESGGASDRPQLHAAMRLCKTKRAMLVIAKLDRLARNVSFISQLMESGVEFVAADMPTATKLTIHIIAAMAEYEKDVIAQRTIASLKAAKARGQKLGNPKLSLTAAKGTATGVQRADQFAAKVMPNIEAFRSMGIKTLAGIASSLNATGVKTQRGGAWTPAGVSNIIKRSASRSKAK